MNTTRGKLGTDPIKKDVPYRESINCNFCILHFTREQYQNSVVPQFQATIR